MKYIDTNKLRTEVNKLRQDWLDDSTGLEVGEEGAALGAAISILDSFDDIINSLQQEQLEVNLKKEVEQYFQGLWPGMETAEQCNTDLHFTPPAIMRLVTHFYELGSNTKNS